MALPDVISSGFTRSAGFLQAGAGVAWLACFFCGCQHDPSAFQNAGRGYAQGGAVPLGQRLQPGGAAAPASAPSYQYTRAVNGRPLPQPAAGGVPDRWDSGQTWSQRTQGEQANWRGSGVAWQNGARQSPGHYSQDQRPTAPSTPASSWQAAPIYSNTPAGRNQPAVAPAARSYPAAGDSYIIQKGDNLSRIAQRFNVSLEALMRVNGLQRDQVIFPGQPLRIPGR